MSDDRGPELPPLDPTSLDPAPLDPGPPDPELAALLAVPPLDEVTRRSLVRVAVDERPRAARPVGRATAAFGVAAAVLIGVVVGAVVVTRPDDPQTTTAARAPEATEVSPNDAGKEAGADAAAPGLLPAAGSETQLGDLGSIADPTALRDAITTRFEAGESLAASSLADTCVARGPAAAGLVAFSAVGTATYADVGPIVVLVGTTPEGGDVAVAVSPTECTVVGSVQLHD